MMAGRLARIVCKGPRNGFTLVEVLVSLGLLALVLALLSGALRFAQSTWDAAARLDAHASAGTAEGFLRARLGEAMSLYEQTATGLVRLAFEGTGQSLSFVAPAANGPAGAGLYHHALDVAPGTGWGRPHGSLRLKLVPYQAKQSEPGGAAAVQEEHVLLGNVRSLKLRYFGPAALSAQPAWHAAWTRTNALPSLVEMTIARSDGGDAAHLIIELRLRPGAP
jgi:prepilin-type N-terminal cleavage/methylation domain-containing protein